MSISLYYSAEVGKTEVLWRIFSFRHTLTVSLPPRPFPVDELLKKIAELQSAVNTGKDSL